MCVNDEIDDAIKNFKQSIEAIEGVDVIGFDANQEQDTIIKDIQHGWIEREPGNNRKVGINADLKIEGR